MKIGDDELELPHASPEMQQRVLDAFSRVDGDQTARCVSPRVTSSAAAGQPFVQPKNGPKSRVAVKPGK